MLFIYREAYYNKEIKSDVTEIIIAKNKEGTCETVKLD
ncbi:MAG: hypothetical protein HFJ30_04395 [Clostridia bacterium]|nr:hypothetical protein [Clostridia bacterium]